MARQQYFMVAQRVEVVGFNQTVHQRVQLVNHETDRTELIQVVFQMHADVLTEEDLSGLVVGVAEANIKKEPEAVSEVAEALLASDIPHILGGLDKHLNLIAASSVAEPPVEQPGVDLPIVQISEGLEYDDEWNKELLFLVEQS